MKIKSVVAGSIASVHDISVDDQILEINGHSLEDIVDYRFLSADHLLRLKLKSKAGRLKLVSVKKAPDEDLGLEFHPMRYKSCRNNCIFCFVHQLPKGLRRALYFKDEDFRLSFLHGNFITLTNTLDNDIQRIVGQRLSPLYISVHATDGGLRQKILGNPNIPEIMPLVKRLAEARIQMHTQIVVCPGINDGRYLEKSVEDLSALYPHVKSLAVVPVGLTKFREKLPEIKPVGVASSRKIVQLVDNRQRHFRRKLGCGFVYAADELFIKAGLEIPGARYYDEFDQAENGVGMMRKFLDTFKSKRKRLPRGLKRKLSLAMVTGVSAFGLMEQIVQEHFSSIRGLKVRVVPVKNDFFGRSVTVGGLLAGADVISALRQKKNIGDVILLPPNCVNEDGLFLDDLAPRDIERALGRKVVVGSYDLVETLGGLFRKIGD
jgi:putative radical SAM enzyme (TIGR03279 family)